MRLGLYTVYLTRVDDSDEDIVGLMIVAAEDWKQLERLVNEKLKDDGSAKTLAPLLTPLQEPPDDLSDYAESEGTFVRVDGKPQVLRFTLFS